MRIHHTAFIHRDAVVHPSCEIGPNVIIDGPVRIDANCRLGASAIIMGNTEIASGCTIHSHAVIGDEPQDKHYDQGISYCQVGQNCVIREAVTIHRASLENATTKIGDGCYLMTNSHVAHDCQLENEVTLVSGALFGGFVHVGRGAIISGNVGVHQCVRIGQLAMIRGVSKISQDVPPFCMTDHQGQIIGLNAMGLARQGISIEEQHDLKVLFKIICRSGRIQSRAIKLAADLAKTDLGHQFVCFFMSDTMRGFCKSRERKVRIQQSILTPLKQKCLCK